MLQFTPKWLAWEITARCNLNCIHCRSMAPSGVVADSPLPSGERGRGEGDAPFSTREAFRIIDDITSYAKPVLVLSGGEPLLRDDVFEIAQYGTKKGLRMCLATNGTLINDDVCTEIKRSGIKIVALSLDGASARVHDNFRRQDGAFDGAIRGIGFLKRHGIEFLINSSFTKRNQHDIEGAYKLAKELGAKAWYMFLIVPTGRGREIIDELIDKEDYEDILKWHYAAELAEDRLIMRPTCAPMYFRIIHQMHSSCHSERSEESPCERGDPSSRHTSGLRMTGRRKLDLSTGIDKGCLAGQAICVIDHLGNVLPCSYFPRVAGNLKEKSFKDIWESSKLFKDLRSYGESPSPPGGEGRPARHASPACQRLGAAMAGRQGEAGGGEGGYRGKCGACEYLAVCGGCRARADIINGHYLEEEPFCSYVPKRSVVKL